MAPDIPESVLRNEMAAQRLHGKQIAEYLSQEKAFIEGVGKKEGRRGKDNVYAGIPP
jgi:hypothetical protein